MSKEFFNSFFFNLLLTFVFCVATSYTDLHSEEVQPAVLLLLIFSFILGYKNPQKAWLYSSLLGLSIIAGYGIAKLTGFTPKGQPPDNIFYSLLALIPAFTGGYSGVLLRSIFKKVISQN
ncbi:MAG: hypothetical protein ABI550_07770 [Ignavibacteriaceae bacterium]